MSEVRRQRERRNESRRLGDGIVTRVLTSVASCCKEECTVVHSSHQITTATVMRPITNANTRMKPIGGRAPTNLSKFRLDVGDFLLDIGLRWLLQND
jgi:hypothetical protein